MSVAVHDSLVLRLSCNRGWDTDINEIFMFWDYTKELFGLRGKTCELDGIYPMNVILLRESSTIYVVFFKIVFQKDFICLYYPLKIYLKNCIISPMKHSMIFKSMQELSMLNPIQVEP